MDRMELPLQLEHDTCGLVLHQGIPFPRGKLVDGANVVVTQQGCRLPLRTQTLQTYTDGSVKFLGISFLPRGRGQYVLAETTSFSTPPARFRMEWQEERLLIQGADLAFICAPDGLEELRAGGHRYGSVRPFLQTAPFMENHAFYGTWEAKDCGDWLSLTYHGKVAEAFSCTMCIEVVGSRITVEMRFTALCDMTVYNVGLLCDGEKLRVGGNGAYALFSSADGGHAATVCADVLQFSGMRDVNGFADRRSWIQLSPFYLDSAFRWYDGVSRTVKAVVLLGEEAETSICDLLLYRLQNMPVARLPEQWFADCGLISAVTDFAVYNRMVDGIKFVKERRCGSFEAGAIPFVIDLENDKVGLQEVNPGEVLYNLWFAYFVKQDAELYQMLVEYATMWADVVVYQGRDSALFGANRYYTACHYGEESFFISHPYYGDPSGLYMSYLMTGDTYFEEVFRAMCDHLVINAQRQKSLGYHIPRMDFWANGVAEQFSHVESRYLLSARALTLAYQMYGKPCYLHIAHEIAQWAFAAQAPDGYWYQAYFNDGQPLVQAGQTKPAVKLYVMLYGVRGLYPYYEETNDPTVLTVFKLFSHFLVRELNTYGMLYDPCGNPDLYEENEDNTRGSSPMCDIMAAEVLYVTYKYTREPAFKFAMEQCLRSFIASMGPGGFNAQKHCLPDYCDGLVGGVIAGQNTNFLRILPEMYNDLLEWGLEIDGLADILSPAAEDLTQFDHRKWSSIEFPLNIFRSHSRTIIYGINYSGKLSGQWEKEVEVVVETTHSFRGANCLLLPDGRMQISKHLKQFEAIFAVENENR